VVADLLALATGVTVPVPELAAPRHALAAAARAVPARVERLLQPSSPARSALFAAALAAALALLAAAPITLTFFTTR
jgi:hypothetical protein